MKVLKYILYAIIILAILFFAVGIIKPTVSYGHEITVNKPIEEAWAVSQDETKYGQWLEGFKSMELIEGEKFTEGSKYKVTVNPGEGQEDFEMTETLISIEEFDHIEMHFDSEFMDFEQIMTFRQVDGGVKVKTDSKVMGKGLMTKSMFAVMEMLGGSFTKQEAKNIENLKKVIEANTDEYFPDDNAQDEELGASESEVG